MSELHAGSRRVVRCWRLVGVSDEFVQVPDAEDGDHGVDAHRQILKDFRNERSSPSVLEFTKFPLMPPDVVVLAPRPSATRCDDQLALDRTWRSAPRAQGCWAAIACGMLITPGRNV